MAGVKAVSVTSDAALSRFASNIYCCERCGHLQKKHSPGEQDEIRSVYESYEIYPFTQGGEPLVYPDNAPPKTRTFHALESCLPYLPAKGKLLDFGAGNGPVTRSASLLLPEWELFAYDLGDKYRKDILGVPGVKGFFTGSLAQIPVKSFDLIVLWHSLEHLPDPAAILSQLRELLREDGRVLIQVPDVRRTPFDLAVIDHCSHFTKECLSQLCRKSGLAVVKDGESWTHNCITFLLKKTPVIAKQITNNRSPDAKRLFEWLNRAVTFFESTANRRDYALFGVGISSFWLFGQLTRKPLCFVDMDKRSVGHKIESVPIFFPNEISAGLDIFMPFTRPSGEKIVGKIMRKYPSIPIERFVFSPSDF